MKTLEVVVGAQYGSEAKGHVVQRLAERSIANNGSTAVVRVAGPNAGHTGHDATGRPWALRQVPVAAVVPGPMILGIAAGSEIDPPVLLDEYDRLKDAGLFKDKFLWVHGSATVITDVHKAQENRPLRHPADDQYDQGNLVERVGSTGKGIGAARADRLMRSAKRVVDDEGLVEELVKRGIPIADPDYQISEGVHDGMNLIIEGTQGYGLGLHGKHYPQCTSSDCRAIDFMAMAGVHPWEFDQTDVWAVARVYPIRVAGNSGYIKGETTWESLGLEPEFTTVTKKMRRVGEPDWDLVGQAVRANGGAPTVRVALTMVDQMFPELKGSRIERLDGELYAMVRDIERKIRAQIKMIATGPNTATFI